MKVNMFVTKNDIKNGERGCAQKCPVANSFFRRLKQKYRNNISVGNFTAKISTFNFTLPEKVREFIGKFDKNRKSVTPIKFELNIPIQLLKR